MNRCEASRIFWMLPKMGGDTSSECRRKHLHAQRYGLRKWRGSQQCPRVGNSSQPPSGFGTNSCLASGQNERATFTSGFITSK
ncbi:hypothetical protein CDAR_449621 [Caerostris darwini]|uniref:Uncharacterized protein n=1 Tax=Caerostris darwini TaxID=1538125 RepID=A0AAV4QRZ9_9ARAC|nr:hypothetical protein CDAR_449621 [Caerostris darwini]